MADLKTRFGGVPHLPPETAWPACKTCQGHMTFVGQADLADLNAEDLTGLLAMFQCTNDPGMCDDWEPEAGGNAALVFAAEALTSAAPLATPSPPPAEVLREIVVEVRGGDLNAEWGLIGLLGGEPQWVQDDETPTCTCGQPMEFVLQLGEQRDMNFGGDGCAFAFLCRGCSEARFLWQN